jgi:hypothetical protein
MTTFDVKPAGRGSYGGRWIALVLDHRGRSSLLSIPPLTSFGVTRPLDGSRSPFRHGRRSTRELPNDSVTLSKEEVRCLLLRSIHRGWSTVAPSDRGRVEDWEEIHGFQSPDEFRRFERWIREALRDGSAIEIPVDRPYSGSVFEERWFRAVSGRIWRLVKPDAPFLGRVRSYSRDNAIK